MRRRRTCRSEIFVGGEQFQCGRLEGHHRQWPHEHCTPWYTISWPVKGGSNGNQRQIHPQGPAEPEAAAAGTAGGAPGEGVSGGDPSLGRNWVPYPPCVPEGDWTHVAAGWRWRGGVSRNLLFEGVDRTALSGGAARRSLTTEARIPAPSRLERRSHDTGWRTRYRRSQWILRRGNLPHRISLWLCATLRGGPRPERR